MKDFRKWMRGDVPNVPNLSRMFKDFRKCIGGIVDVPNVPNVPMVLKDPIGRGSKRTNLYHDICRIYANGLGERKCFQTFIKVQRFWKIL